MRVMSHVIVTVHTSGAQPVHTAAGQRLREREFFRTGTLRDSEMHLKVLREDLDTSWRAGG